MRDDVDHETWFRPALDECREQACEPRRADEMQPLDRITYWWHGVLVLAVVKAAYPHGPERTEIHLLVARAVRDANPEHASEPLYGLVHTFNNDDLFWRVHPREHPEWQ